MPPVDRAELERALRTLNLNHVDVRDDIMQLAAHVVVLTEHLARALDRPELPDEIAADVPQRLEDIRVEATQGLQRVMMEPDNDKYTVEPADVPCAELFHLCQARCCKLRFPLSTEDLDEGIIKWDYGKPYQIRQRESDGRCTHNEVGTGRCTVHANRPRICRTYSCATDKRIWLDFEKRIPAPMSALATPRSRGDADANISLVDRLRERQLTHLCEREAIDGKFGEK